MNTDLVLNNGLKSTKEIPEHKIVRKYNSVKGII
jgi:hypothetical protein